LLEPLNPTQMLLGAHSASFWASQSIPRERLLASFDAVLRPPLHIA
jgi:hypothetical protein